MKQKWISALLAVLLLAGGCLGSRAEEIPMSSPNEFRFVDTRFRGVYTTENIDAILEAYHLYDGWYWVTKPDVEQNFRAHENKKGWTQSSKLKSEAQGEEYFYNRGWFGCRWECNTVSAGMPNAYGWGECFGFCQFMGYLLSGEVNPHGKWKMYTSVWEAGGLEVGDIIRVEYTDEKGFHQHSAMVYSVKEGKVRFIQCSGTYHNQLFINWGFRGAGLGNAATVAEVTKFPNLRIHRAYNKGEYVEPEAVWEPEEETVALNLVDLDQGMVVFLDPNNMRAWDVYDNWNSWSRRATEVDETEYTPDEEEPQDSTQETTQAPQEPSGAEQKKDDSTLDFEVQVVSIADLDAEEEDEGPPD